jgi:hypothetical protein
MLAKNRNTQLMQFLGQAMLIDAFKQSWAKLAMDLDRRTDDRLGQFIVTSCRRHPAKGMHIQQGFPP